MKNIYLIGGGGHCVSCIDVIQLEGIFAIKGIFDKGEKIGTSLLGYPIIGTDQDLAKYVKVDNYFLITIGQIKTPQARIKLFKELSDLGANIATIISPRAYVSNFAIVAVGSIVMHDALVNANAQVGENCIINTKALIEHDARVEAHCHISTAAIINGGCTIGTGSFVGSNAVLKEALTLPALSVVSAGTFLKNDDSKN